MRRQDEIDKLLGRGQFSVPPPIPEEIDYSKLQHPGAPTGFQAPEPPPAMPPVSQLKDPMNRQLMEERMNPEPQLGTQTEKALSDKQLLEQYLSDKFMQGDIDSADERARKAQLYASLGGAMNTITKGLTGAEIEPDVYQKMFAQDLNAPKNALEKRREMRETLLKKYGLGIQEKESEARLKEAQANNAYRNKMLELEQEKVDLAKSKTLPPGMEKVIEDEAKTAADWASGGRESFNSGVNRLNSAMEKLSKMSDSWGSRGRARFGENALSSEQLSVQQDISDAVLPALKATFPGNTSDAELRTLAKSFVDFRLSPQENIKNIQAKIGDLKAKAATKEQIAAKFGRGTQAVSNEQQVQPGTVAMKAIRKADGKPVTLKGTQQEVDEALKSGAYEVR